MEERADLIKGALDRFEMGTSGLRAFGGEGQRRQPARAEIGAGPLESMRDRAPWSAVGQRLVHAAQIHLGGGQKQRRKFSFELRIAVREAAQMIQIKDRIASRLVAAPDQLLDQPQQALDL